MACPYFCPTTPIQERWWPHPLRLPLGGGYRGLCAADPAGDATPSERALQQWCNLGYARGHCARFPPGAGPDAVRFGLSDGGDGLLAVDYALEQGHLPHQHGRLEFDTRRRAFLAAPAGRLLRRQAEAYMESYLRQAAKAGQ